MDVDALNEPKPNSSAITSMSGIGRGTLAPTACQGGS
jgi:hypothetical protein